MKYIALLLCMQLCVASDTKPVQKNKSHEKKGEQPIPKITKEMLENMDDETFSEMISKPGAYQGLFGKL